MGKKELSATQIIGNRIKAKGLRGEGFARVLFVVVPQLDLNFRNDAVQYDTVPAQLEFVLSASPAVAHGDLEGVPREGHEVRQGEEQVVPCGGEGGAFAMHEMNLEGLRIWNRSKWEFLL